MIHIPAFSLTGTADFSSIKTELQNLERTIGNLRVPQIKTDVATPNFSNFFSAIDKAEKQATIKIKPEIDKSFGGGLSSFLNSEKGNFNNVGKELGQNLTMGMQQQFGMAGGVATSFAGALGGIGIAAVAGIAGVAALGAASVNTAKNWQTLMAGVSKTTGVEGAALDALGSKLQDIRIKTGATAESITSAVVTAGSIGIPTAELAEFAQVSLQMGSAFSMSSDEAASGIAAIGNSVKPASESWTEFANKAGSSINVLADTMRTSETQIITGMKHLSGTFGLLKPPEDTIPAWQALVATIQSLGLEGDSAGEALKDAATYITRNEKNKISDLLGISGEQLQIDVRSNAPELFQRIALAISALPLEQQGEALKAFGQSGAQGIGMLMGDIDQTTGKFKILGTAIESSENAWKQGISLSGAYAKSQATLDAALSKLTASLDVAGQKLGTVMLPAITKVVEGLTVGVDAAIQFGEAIASSIGGAASIASSVISGKSLSETDSAFLAAIGVKKTEAQTAQPLTQEQKFAEAQVNAANLGQGTGNSYVDGLNAALDIGVPKALTDAYLGDALKTGKTAAASAGKQTAEEFVKTQDEYIKSHSSGSYTSTMMQQMSAQQSVESGPAYKYAYQQKLLDSVIYPLADSYKIQKYSRSTDIGGFLQVTDMEGEVITSEQYTSDEELDKLAKRLKDSVKPTFTDMPKYMKTAGDDISDALVNILSDGVIAFEEKDELKNYLKSLETLKTTYPVEFEASHLDDLRQKVTDAVTGVLVTFDASELELNFSKFISENASMYETIYQKTGVVSYESNEKLLHNALIAAPQEAQDLYAELQDAIASGDLQSLQKIPAIIGEIADVAPELLTMQGTTDRLNTAQELYEDNLRNLGTSTQTQTTNGDILGGTFLRTSQQGDILSTTFAGLASAASSVAIALSSARAYAATGATMPYSPVSMTSAIGSNAATYTKATTSQYAFSPLLNLPKLAEGGKVTKGGLAWIGEAGTEYVIPESQIKGLYPDFAKAAKGSMKWLTGEQYFEDYPGARISAPTSYRWSSYPDAPQVQQLHTENMQTAWLSEGQTTGLDMISSEIRALQLASIGKSQVQPWFARGEIKQPDWWVEAATALSPKYASNWAASKGGTVPSIVEDVGTKSATKLTGSSEWASIYDNSGTCIAFVEPDPSLKFTPGKTKNVALDRTAWNAIYDNSGTCIAFVEPDPSLKFTPAGGSVSSNDAADVLESIDANTRNTKLAIDNQIDVLKLGIFATSGMKDVKGTFETTGNDALVVGLSKEGYVVTYDPRDDTCEGIPFNAPDPSLKTTDKKYLGLTSGYSTWKKEREDLGLSSTVATAANSDLADEQSKMLDEQKKTSESSEQTAKNTQDVYRTLGQQYALQKQALAVNGAAANALVTMAGSSVGGTGLYGSTAGSFWGGLSIGGGGGSIGTGASMSGWGAQASAAASSGQSSTFGSVQWAEGGITDHPVFGVFGEAGREAFVPISDKAAGRRILPQVMRELGVRTFATGGIVGSGGLSTLVESIGGTTIAPVYNINGSGLSSSQLATVLEKHDKKLLEQVAKKTVLSARRRG